MHEFKVISQAVIAVIASFGSFIFGIGLGWSAPAGPKLMSDEINFKMQKNELALAASMVACGGLFSSFINGYIRNRFGTVKAIIIYSIPNLIGYLLLIFAQKPWMFIFGRFCIGIACGGYSFNNLTYIGEIASKQIRGILLTFYEINIKTGVLFIFVLGTVTNLVIMNTICAVIIVLYAIAFTFFPETPMYLMTKGKVDDAKKSLEILRGSDYNYDNEMKEIQDEIDEIEATKLPFWQEIRNKATRKAFCIVAMLFVFFHMSGTDAVIFYMTTILIESGTKFDPFVATSVLGLIQLLATIASAFLIDRYGRRFLMISSNITMVFGQLGIGFYFYFKNIIGINGYEYLTIVFLCLFLIGFSFGVASVTFVLVGELFSLNAKKVISPVAQGISFLFSFIVATFFPSVADSIGIHNTFFIFAGFCFLSVICVSLFLPETKGKSLFEIQKLLVNKK